MLDWKLNLILSGRDARLKLPDIPQWWVLWIILETTVGFYFHTSSYIFPAVCVAKRLRKGRFKEENSNKNILFLSVVFPVVLIEARVSLTTDSQMTNFCFYNLHPCRGNTFNFYVSFTSGSDIYAEIPDGTADSGGESCLAENVSKMHPVLK